MNDTSRKVLAEQKRKCDDELARETAYRDQLCGDLAVSDARIDSLRIASVELAATLGATADA